MKAVLELIEPQMEVYFRKNYIDSLKTILCIIDICDLVGFEHKYFYKHVENSIMSYLARNPKYVLYEKDLRFLNERLLKRGYGSNNLRKLILSTL